jgi:predicted acyltransferase
MVIGLFTVNFPLLNNKATGMNKSWFEIFTVTAFFLIWNMYPKIEGSRKYFYRGLQIAGAILLLVLALIYRGQGENNGEIVPLQPRWWGILGLIGWTYLVNATLYLFLQKSVLLLFLSWLAFTLFNIAGHAGVFGTNEVFIGNGAFHAFTFAGILGAIFLQNFRQKQEKMVKFLSYISLAGVLFIVVGLFLRNFFIISKIYATPPWIFICTGISFIVFAIVFLVVDLKKKEHYFTFIKAAGTSTLTCYLLPYIYYGFADLYKLNLPDWLHHGVIGIIKSILFSILIIWITSFLEKLKIRIKI